MDKDCVKKSLVVTKIRQKKKKLLLRPYLKRRSCARQGYKPEDVLAAMRAIWRGMSRQQAAKIFNIPRSTLLEKLDGKHTFGKSPGTKPVLNEPGGHHLEAWVIDMHRRGFLLRTKDFDVAKGIIDREQLPSSFKNGVPGYSWTQNFRQHHSQVSDYSPNSPRAVSDCGQSVLTREEVRQWCQQLRNFITPSGHVDILNDPNRIFNVDHGELLFDATTGQFLEQHHAQHSDDCGLEQRAKRLAPGVECVSVVTTFSASGRLAPVMFVYPLKELPHEVVKSFPSGWVGTHTDCGSLSGKTFLDYLVTLRQWLEDEDVHFPVLLLVDSHRSCLNPNVTHYCEEHGFILYCLFPTPRPAVADLISALFQDSFEGITKYNLAVRFREALNALDDSDNSKSVFHTYGILPFLRTVLQTLMELSSEPLRDSLCSSSPGINDCSIVEHEPGLFSDIAIKEQFSDCECDYDLMPVEGEIEVEFPSCWNPHAVAALHSELLTGPGSISETTSYLMVGQTSAHILSSGEEYVDQPGVNARLVIAPLSSPLHETEKGIELLDSEIDQVLGAIKSSAQPSLSEDHISPANNPSEEPFLGFSSIKNAVTYNSLDAHCCVRFLEKFLLEKGLLEDFKAARVTRQWGGLSEAKILFDVWLAAHDESYSAQT